MKINYIKLSDQVNEMKKAVRFRKNKLPTRSEALFTLNFITIPVSLNYIIISVIIVYHKFCVIQPYHNSYFIKL